MFGVFDTAIDQVNGGDGAGRDIITDFTSGVDKISLQWLTRVFMAPWACPEAGRGRSAIRPHRKVSL